MRIRPARLEDAAPLAAVHVRAWRWAYRGQMPDAFLDGLTVESREAMWSDALAGWDRAVRIWVAEEEDGGRPLGFCWTGPSEDGNAEPGAMEVYALYLEPDAVGTGLGRELFAHAVDDLRERGVRSASLWVLATNGRARRFYERAGWVSDGATSTQRADCANLPTVRYRLDLG